jgi:hypothetical protein
VLTLEQGEENAMLNDMAQLAIDSEPGFLASVGFWARSLDDRQSARAFPLIRAEAD